MRSFRGRESRRLAKPANRRQRRGQRRRVSARSTWRARTGRAHTRQPSGSSPEWSKPAGAPPKPQKRMTRSPAHQTHRQKGWGGSDRREAGQARELLRGESEISEDKRIQSRAERNPLDTGTRERG